LRHAAATSDSAIWSGEKVLFFRHWLRSPLGIGAVLPSGAAVAATMAGELNLSRPGMVLELGGGTGSLTHGLLAAGCPPERLISVEREPGLAALLRRRFPAIRVIEGDAAALSDLLAACGARRLAGVVSSLPIKWFPIATQRAVIGACFDRLDEDGPFLQLTNALVSPLPVSRLGLGGRQVARVWTHFPPVQIWRYWRITQRDSSGER
jgi:phosphatidylethanolamine/phosphatidyl-N-methylethanolamine N-methyltransferase